jgi:hypothetical protein
MVRKKIIAWAVITAMIMCSFVPQSAEAGSFEWETSKTIGGTEESGCLKVTITTDGDIYVERYSGSKWIKQYYQPSDVVLNVDGTLYETGVYYGALANQLITKIKPRPQAADDKSITTTWVQEHYRLPRH